MDQVILVTGANGFVGRNVVHHLGARPGVRIVATDLQESLVPLNGRCAGTSGYVQGDLSCREFVSALAQRGPFTTIIHLAAVISQASDIETYSSIMNSNIRATFLLLDMAKMQHSRVIFPSTALVYGSQKGPFREDMVTGPGDFYALSKLTSEQLMGFYASRYDVRSVVLRIGILYGTSQTGTMFIPALISSLLHGKEFPMTKGEQSRDFVFIEDLVNVLQAAIDNPEITGIFNVGTGVPSMLRDVALLAERMIGTSGLLKLGAVAYREKESWEYCLDSTKLRHALGTAPSTPLEVGLGRTIDYERARSEQYA